MTRTCLDLFAGLGGFSQAFEAADGWDVVQVDIEERFDPDIRADVFDLRPADLPAADVILASPPCTTFSRVGNHDQWDHDAREPTGELAREHVTLVYHTRGLIEALAPDYWVMENPMGRLRWLLGEPTGTVTYCRYGRPYMKPTDLWGVHPPMTYRRCAEGDPCHATNKPARDGGFGGMHGVEGYTEDAADRAKVPRELSEAILDAVESAYEHPRHTTEQATLGVAAKE